MDRYLLLVIWGEGKVPSAAAGEAEHGPGVSSFEGTEKQSGKRWAERDREKLAGTGRNLGFVIETWILSYPWKL